MKILVGCEESQAVTIAFRELGFEAYSCDLKPCGGPNPDWHIQGDIFIAVEELKPTLAILHPPCTYLTVTANKWLKDQPARKSGALVGEARREARREAIEFFIRLAEINVPHICLENPVGCMSSEWRKPDQIIQPFMFGDEAMKLTCLWLKNLPKLIHSNMPDLFNDKITHVGKGERVVFKSGKSAPKWYVDAAKHDAYNRAEIRSKTFPGIAKAMAEQWGEFLRVKYSIQQAA